MIPRIIHYCWFGNKDKLKPYEKHIATWSKLMPSYRIKKWSEANSPMDNDYVKEAYNKGLWSRVSNYIRLYALYTEGGIYLDTDVELLKSLDSLALKNKCFLGFQSVTKIPGWVNNAIFGSSPGFHFLKSCINLTVSIFKNDKRFELQPRVTTSVLENMGLCYYGEQTIEDVKLYPAEYFFPYHWEDTFSPDCIKENTYAIHHWAGSWLDDRICLKHK